MTSMISDGEDEDDDEDQGDEQEAGVDDAEEDLQQPETEFAADQDDVDEGQTEQHVDEASDHEDMDEVRPRRQSKPWMSSDNEWFTYILADVKWYVTGGVVWLQSQQETDNSQ
jgi:hypothetical protein